MENGRGLMLLAGRIMATIGRAKPRLPDQADALTAALERVAGATQAAWANRDPAEALANAVPYMQAFGHVVIAWIWLELQLAANASENEARRAGMERAGAYFYHYELPKIDAWLRVVESRDMTCAATPEEAF
jgi:butyryl-CoA dehydrogenase